MFLVVFLPFYFAFSKREFWWEKNDQDIAILWLHYLFKYNATFFLFVMTFRVATTETSAIHFLPSLRRSDVPSESKHKVSTQLLLRQNFHCPQ